MAGPIEVEGFINPQGKLEVALPSNVPPGKVHVIVDLEQTIGEEQQLAKKYFDLALSSYKLGDIQLAIDSFNQTLTLGPQFIHLYSHEDLQKLVLSLSSLFFPAVQQLQQSNVESHETSELSRPMRIFLATLSQELRVPVNSVIGFSRVLLKGAGGPLNSSQEQDITTILKSGEHLLQLINDLLDATLIAVDGMELSCDYFSVADTITRVIADVSGLIKDRPVKVQHTLPTDLPDVYGDEFRTRQILNHLISNARRFTRTGSISISASCINDSMVQISITDTGMGISEEEQNLIFAMPYQGQDRLKPVTTGLGLGLPIARSLAEMQGGKLWLAKSEVGVGSTFCLTIPTQPE